MNELRGLTQNEVEERIQQGQVNYTGQSISKTKKEIVKQHTLTYFNFLNISDFRTITESYIYWCNDS